MLAPLLALMLGATPSCGEVWQSIASGKDFKADVLGDILHDDAGKLAALRQHFVEGCDTLPESQRACAAQHPGRMLLQRCGGLARVFHEATTAPDVSGDGLAQMRDRGLAREAVANLRALGQAARMLRLRDGPRASFTFPASVGETPARDCCATPSRTCAPSKSDWSNPAWMALAFSPREPYRFHYSFESGGQGNDAHFVLRAAGDPECDGHPQTWELAGQSEDGKFVVGDAKKK